MDRGILIAAGVAGAVVLLSLPIWKTGKERGVSAIEALAKHTILTPDPETVMVEDSYKNYFIRAGLSGERGPY